LDATGDLKTIRRWFCSRPFANLAVATGAGSDIVVLDVDVERGGLISLDKLESKHGPSPETWEAATGSLGQHVYYRHPGTRIKNSVGRNGKGIAPGLDIRGDGGYVIAPPSLHLCGRRYLWDPMHHPDDGPLADMPQWLIEMTKDSVAQVSEPTPVDGPISEGARNDTLFRLACAMRHHGAPLSAIREAMALTNAERCQPPLPEKEVDRIATSAIRYEPRRISAPRAVPAMLTTVGTRGLAVISAKEIPKWRA
jgi:putative DNA primase/helicase